MAHRKATPEEFRRWADARREADREMRRLRIEELRRLDEPGGYDWRHLDALLDLGFRTATPRTTSGVGRMTCVLLEAERRKKAEASGEGE